MASTLAWLAAASRRAGIVLAADDCTRRRLGLSSRCGAGFTRIAIDGARSPCCFSDCEFYPPEEPDGEPKT